MVTVAGTLTGDPLFMTAAVAGLASVLQGYPHLFCLLQSDGATYLCGFGLSLLRHAQASGAITQTNGPGYVPHAVRAMTISLTNPKVIFFFVSFLPLFQHPGAAPITLVAMMFSVTLISLFWQRLLVCLDHLLLRHLHRRPVLARLGRRLAELTLLGFGVRLGLQIRQF